MSSIEGDSWLGHKLIRNPAIVTADVHKAFGYAKMLGENRCMFKMICSADPHLDYIPQKLINWALKNVIYVYLGYIGQKAKNLPDEYKKLIEEKKEYYDELIRRIEML